VRFAIWYRHPTQFDPPSRQASDSGVRYLVGFETEFILLKKTGDKSIQAVNDHPWSATRALLSGSPEAACLEEIALVLQDCGIQVEMLHAEAAPGQVGHFRESSSHHSPLMIV
jgi:glutamine synthetase